MFTLCGDKSGQLLSLKDGKSNILLEETEKEIILSFSPKTNFNQYFDTYQLQMFLKRAAAKGTMAFSWVLKYLLNRKTFVLFK